MQVAVSLTSSLKREEFAAIFRDSAGKAYRYDPKAEARHSSDRTISLHHNYKKVHYDSVFLIMRLLWEQLHEVYTQPSDWVPGKNNGVHHHLMFAKVYTPKYVGHIKGLDGDFHRVVDVAGVAISVYECLKQQSRNNKQSMFSWKGLDLSPDDAKMVASKVAVLAFQYLPSLPFIAA